MTAWGYVRLWAVASTGAPNVPGRGPHWGHPTPAGRTGASADAPHPSPPGARALCNRNSPMNESIMRLRPPGAPCFSFVSHGAAECRRRSPPEVPRTLPADRSADGDGVVVEAFAPTPISVDVSISIGFLYGKFIWMMIDMWLFLWK